MQSCGNTIKALNECMRQCRSVKPETINVLALIVCVFVDNEVMRLTRMEVFAMVRLEKSVSSLCKLLVGSSWYIIQCKLMAEEWDL